MLYLEACHEKCKERIISSDYQPHWARTSGPSCSAAIIFTAKGARRVLQLISPIFWGIDNMYRAAIRAGLVEAYVIIPTAFMQDGFWGSGIQSLREDGRKHGDRSLPGILHRPFSILCSDDGLGELALVVVQLSEPTPFVRRALCTPRRRLKALIVADTLFPRYLSRPDAWRSLVYTTRDREGGWAEVGRWPQRYGHHGVLLQLDARSACFESAEGGGCELRVQGVARDGGAAHVRHVSPPAACAP